jgi:gas vesicle protein
VEGSGGMIGFVVGGIVGFVVAALLAAGRSEL